MTTPSPVIENTELYPLLSPQQISRLSSSAARESVAAGDILYKPGDTGVSLFILLSASVAVLQPVASGERLVTTLMPRMFTGEAGMIGGQRAVVLARVLHPGEVLRLSPSALRTIITSDGALSEILLKAFLLRRLMLIERRLGNVVVISSLTAGRTERIREFLDRNGHPYTYIDLESDEGSQALLTRFNVKQDDLPLVICNNGAALRNPSLRQVADCLGLNDNLRDSLLQDLIIIGAGPAGLGTAVYAASEGLLPLVLEGHAPGGQAATSSRIENYLGFPTGVSGQELASRAAAQAQKFGAKLTVARSAIRLQRQLAPYELVLNDGTSVFARTLVIATGACYKKIALPEVERYEGNGVHYGATHLEAQQCVGEEVVVIGGGNSAGQAALFLTQAAARVHLLVRSTGLSKTMSQYLIRRILANPSIELHYETELVGLTGKPSLHRALWTHRSSGRTCEKHIRHIFVMTGASPNTHWLRGTVALDNNGFVLTGRELPLLPQARTDAPWPLRRPPHMFETSLPGVFAVGDVRAGSVKRVASAVGEGAIAVSLVHRVLQEDLALDPA